MKKSFLPVLVAATLFIPFALSGCGASDDGGGGPPQGSNHSGISYATGTSDRYFGHADYASNKLAGYTDQQIKDYLDANPNLLRQGNVPGGGGIYDQIDSSITNTARQPQQQPQQQPQ